MNLTSQGNAQIDQLEPAIPFTVRDGLPNIAAKLKAGQAVNIVFLGGSITEAGASPKGYVTFIGDWLKAQYPTEKVTVFNAGIGGTGSEYGDKRYDRDVLSRNPDLVFFYTLDKDHLDNYKGGMLPPSASGHERVAAFYGIPTVGTGLNAASKILAGEALAFQKDVKRDSNGLDIDLETLLVAGEELAFVPDVDAWSGDWYNLQIGVGLLE